MTRKDRELIARVIRGLGFNRGQRDYIARQFAAALEAENPGFDVHRFTLACTLSNKTIDKPRRAK